MSRFGGKVVLVTGGGSGIGRGIVDLFAAEGACVAIFDIEAQWARDTEAQLKAKGAQAVGIHGDVSKGEEVQGAMRRCVQEWGRLDILVNNAGTSIRSNESLNFTELPEAEWDWIMAVNVKGPFLCIQAVAPIMRSAGGGQYNQHHLYLSPFLLPYKGSV